MRVLIGLYAYMSAAYLKDRIFIVFTCLFTCLSTDLSTYVLVYICVFIQVGGIPRRGKCCVSPGAHLCARSTLHRYVLFLSIYVYIYMHIGTYIYVYIYIYIYIYICSSLCTVRSSSVRSFSIYLCIYLSICLSIYIYISVRYFSIYLFVYLFYHLILFYFCSSVYYAELAGGSDDNTLSIYLFFPSYLIILGGYHLTQKKTLILLDQLCSLGVSETALQWFKSFLWNQVFVVAGKFKQSCIIISVIIELLPSIIPFSRGQKVCSLLYYVTQPNRAVIINDSCFKGTKNFVPLMPTKQICYYQ